MESFEDKVAVITGAGSGIGRGTALALADAGCHVVAADIDEDNAAKVAAAVEARGRRALGARVDVSQPDSVDALAKRVEAEMGGVDVLCNNAGVYLGGPMRDATFDDWRFVLSVNPRRRLPRRPALHADAARAGPRRARRQHGFGRRLPVARRRRRLRDEQVRRRRVQRGAAH